MAESSNAREQWYFTAEQLQNSPSRKCGIDADKELQYRQQTAYLIQEMGQHLRVSQLCINTAIVYMHRFYAFHSFTHFHRNGIAAASLFLAAKVEEQPRKLEHVIRIANMCLMSEEPTKDSYLEQAQDLVFNENVLLQTLGFDVAIDHPHTHVVKTCHLVKAGKDLAQTSYFMASNSLHLTTMCLQYKPTVVACFCIHLACKWSSWEIPNSTEGRPWFHYVDKSVTTDLLHQLQEEFIQIYQKSPSRLKNKLNSIKALVQGTKAEDSGQPQQKGSNSTSSSSSAAASQPQGHRSGSNSSGSGGNHHHHHHHHHHHNSQKAGPGGQQQQQQQPQPVSMGQSQAKQSSSFNQQSSSSSRPRGDGKHAGGVPQQQQQPPNSSGSHRSGGGGGGNGNSGMHNNNGSRSTVEGSYSSSSNKSRPQMPPQQQQSSSQAPSSSMTSGGGGGSSKSSSSTSSSSNNTGQKYNQQPPPQSAPAAAAYSATSSSSAALEQQNNNSNSSGKSNSPRAPQQAGNQPLFVGSYGDTNQRKGTIADDAFQFSIDDLRDADSQDSNQMGGLSAAAAAAKSQKLQSFFCPDWKEDYTSGNTEHAKMNLPIGSTGDTKAPAAMQQQQQHQRAMQQQQQQQQQQQKGGPSGSSGNNSNNMRKPEKKPDHRAQAFAGGATAGGNANSSITNTSSGGSSRQQQQQQQQHHNMGPGKGSSSSSSSKRPYDEMMSSSGGSGPSGSDLNNMLSGSSSGGGAQGQDYARDPKARRSEVVDMMGGGGAADGGVMNSNSNPYDPMRDRQRIPIEKDFNDYRDAGVSSNKQQQQQLQQGLISGNSNSSLGGMLPNPTSSLSGPSAAATSSSSVSSSASKFSHSIETNPDLVSSLLKESLNTEHTKPFTTIPATAVTGGGAGLGQINNGPMASGGSGLGVGGASTVSTSQLDQLINAPLQPFQQMRTATVVNGSTDGMLATGGDSNASAPTGEEDHYRHKSEKKKKKEKHKNKDKEKDRGSKEERKKHKKDKERHKERQHYEHAGPPHTDDGGVLGPIKLKIPKMNSGGGGESSESMGGSFKIKIPTNPEPMGPLKIKISKDKFMGKDSADGGLTASLDGGGGYHKKKDKEKSSKRDY